MDELLLTLAAITPSGTSSGDLPPSDQPRGYVALVLYGVLGIGFSFFCSIAEAVLLSVSPSYIATLKEKSAAQAQRLEHLKHNIDRPLAAILSLNTIAHTVGAAGVGAEAAAIWGSRAVGLASAVMTLLILVLSEIIPKTIGAMHWRQLAPSMATTVQVLIWLLYPLVWLSELLTRLLGGGHPPQVVTREEVAAMAKLSAHEGEIDREESRVLHNLLRLESLTVKDIMTPRTVMIALPEEMSVEDALHSQPDLPVSRIPVYSDGIDQVTGLVLKDDLLLARSQGRGDQPLKEFRRDIRAVPATSSLKKLFEVLLGEREHLALVVDEFGGTDGLVTLEDLLETLLGIEIVDEHDTTADMQHLAREKWRHRVEQLGIRVEEAGTGEGGSPET